MQSEEVGKQTPLNGRQWVTSPACIIRTFNKFWRPLMMVSHFFLGSWYYILNLFHMSHSHPAEAERHSHPDLWFVWSFTAMDVKGWTPFFPELFTTSLMCCSSSAYKAVCWKHSRAARRCCRRQYTLYCSLCAHLTLDSTVSHPTSISSLMTHNCYHGLYK